MDTENEYLQARRTWLIPFVFLLTLLLVYRGFSTRLYVNSLLELAVAGGLFYTLIVTLSILSRFPLAMAYDPRKFQSIQFEPTVTVIVPCYNEEESIEATIVKIFQSDYPAEKLDVIAINDGSKDRSLSILQALAESYPRLHVVNFEKNQGKRAGLHYGFLNSNTEIVVVVDSDTQLYADCIKEIVKPLIDHKVAGVSGHTDVRNVQTALGKMQEANYFALFHLYKKAESLLSAVTCLPGCASAYRRTIVNTFIDEWKNQKFLGVPCVVGEDRGLTTYLLKLGYKAIYTPAARAETSVPSTIRSLIRQRIRWKRSFLREMSIQATFMYKRKAAILFYPYMISNFISPFVTILLLFVLPFYVGGESLFVSFGGIALITLLYASYSKMYRRSFSTVWLAAWSFFNMAVMPWVSIYAWLTVTEGAWMTR